MKRTAGPPTVPGAITQALFRPQDAREVTDEYEAAIAHVRAKARAQVADFTPSQRADAETERGQDVRWEAFTAGLMGLVTLAVLVLRPGLIASSEAPWRTWLGTPQIVWVGLNAVTVVVGVHASIRALRTALRWKKDLVSWWEDESELRFDLYGECWGFLPKRLEDLAALDRENGHV